jgi:hypothetical protein
LAERRVDRGARGQCGSPALFYAISSHHPAMVRWLLSQGVDLSQRDEFGTSALTRAVENEDLDSVEVLLEAGASVDAVGYDSPLKSASSRDIILRLLEAGADPADANQRILLGMEEPTPEPLSALTLEEFSQAPSRIFGDRNPQRMRQPFWEAMIRGGVSAYAAREHFRPHGLQVAEAVWSAARFGQSLTFLPDGRAIQIGGEHEDYYDQDFCIYNDVFVHDPVAGIAIYGYPPSVFPPTDFHTATLVGEWIYVVGGLGYLDARTYDTTPVYRLHTHTLRIEPVAVNGDAPGWIYSHRARPNGPHQILVWGGEILSESDGQESGQPNHACYILDLNKLTWSKAAMIS